MGFVDILTTAEAAVELGLDESNVRRMCRKGKIAAVKKGHDWLITRAAVEAYRNADRKPGPKRKATGGNVS